MCNLNRVLIKKGISLVLKCIRRHVICYDINTILQWEMASLRFFWCIYNTLKIVWGNYVLLEVCIHWYLVGFICHHVFSFLHNRIHTITWCYSFIFKIINLDIYMKLNCYHKPLIVTYFLNVIIKYLQLQWSIVTIG